MSGWIKYHRKSLKHPLFKKPKVWHYFQYCLLKASHDEKIIVWNKQEMAIERGSFITGRKQAAIDTGLSEQNIRTSIKTLVNLKMIEISTTKSTSKFSYISVCNYRDYQLKVILPNHQTTHEVTSNQPASNQQVTTIKNIKNNKKEKKKDLCPQNGIPEGFEEFYEAYPKKKKKPNAIEAWKQVFLDPKHKKYHGPVEIKVLLKSIEEHKESNDWREEGGKYVPHPASWLRSHGFNDSIRVEVDPEPDDEYEFI